MSKLKKSYEKVSVERKEIRDKKINRETKNGEAVNDKIIRSRQIDIQKEERAMRNVFELRNVTKEETEYRRIEDIALTAIGIRNEINREEKVIIPLQYRIEQNYPNPFNPITKITYSIIKGIIFKRYDSQETMISFFHLPQLI